MDIPVDHSDILEYVGGKNRFFPEGILRGFRSDG
jgi:hypothetical protein